MGFDSLQMSYKYAIALGIALSFTFLVAGIWFFYNRRKVSQNTQITNLEEARADVARRAHHRYGPEKGYLLDPRDVQSGYYGGVFQANSYSPSLFPRSGSLSSTLKSNRRALKPLTLSTSSSSIISIPSPARLSLSRPPNTVTSQERRQSRAVGRTSNASSRRLRTSDLESIGKPSVRTHQPKTSIATSEPTSPTFPNSGHSIGETPRLDLPRDIKASFQSLRPPSDSSDSYFPMVIPKPAPSYSGSRSLSRSSVLCDSFPLPPTTTVQQGEKSPFGGPNDDQTSGKIVAQPQPVNGQILGGSTGALATPLIDSAKRTWGKTIFQEIDTSLENCRDISHPEANVDCQPTGPVERQSRSLRTSASSSIYSSRNSEYFGSVSPRGRQSSRQAQSPRTPPAEPILPLSLTFNEAELFPKFFELPHIQRNHTASISEFGDLYDSYQQHHAKFSKADLGFVVKPGDASEHRRNASNVSGSDLTKGNFI